MALESFGSIPGTNPFNSNTTTAAPSAKKFNWEEWAPTLGRIAGILVAYLAGGKDYGGIAAGSASQTIEQLAQLEEERKQREREQQIQEWEFNLRKEAAEREKKLQEAREKWFGEVEKQLGTLAQPTPEWTFAGESVTEPGLSITGTFGTPAEQWLLAEPAPAEITRVAGTSGDKIAQQLLGQAQAAGGLAYLPESIQSKALEYLWGQAMLEEPEPYVSGEPYIEFQASLHPKNPYKYLAPNSFADPKVLENAADQDKDLWKNETEIDPIAREMKLLELEKLRAQIELTKAQTKKTAETAAKSGGGGEGTPGTWDPGKIYRGSPKVQLWLKLYDQYLQEQGETASLEDIISGKQQPKKAKTLEQWLRSQPGGAKVWAQIVSEFDLFGDPFYATPAGQLIVEKGSIADTIYDVIGRDDTPENRKLLNDLIKRYNEQYNVSHDAKWWYQQAVKLGKIKKKK